VVNNEVSLHKRINFVGVSAEFLHGSTHSGQVDNCRHTGEILKEDAGGLEGDFDVLLGGLSPVENTFNVGS
jgi:hypothetical protein